MLDHLKAITETKVNIGEKKFLNPYSLIQRRISLDENDPKKSLRLQKLKSTLTVVKNRNHSN